MELRLLAWGGVAPSSLLETLYKALLILDGAGRQVRMGGWGREGTQKHLRGRAEGTEGRWTVGRGIISSLRDSVFYWCPGEAFP